MNRALSGPEKKLDECTQAYDSCYKARQKLEAELDHYKTSFKNLRDAQALQTMSEADSNWWKREVASLQGLLKEVHRTSHISNDLAERIAEAING